MTGSSGSIIALLSFLAGVGAAEPQPVAGVSHAEEVKASPVLTAAGVAWWQDRLHQVCLPVAAKAATSP